MPSGAKITIIGNLTKDPVHNMVGDSLVCSFSVAVNTSKRKPDKTGFETNFYSVSVWGKQAENILPRLQKGTKVFVSGDLALTSYTSKAGKEGQSLSLSATDVMVVGRAKMPEREGAPVTQPTADDDEDLEAVLMG